MQTSVSSSRRQRVSGTPISLLKLDSAATVRAERALNAARMSFVDVFPIEPVMPTTRAELRSRTARPIRARAANASCGTSVAAAPRVRASSTNSEPLPTATKRSPGTMRHEPDACEPGDHPARQRPLHSTAVTARSEVTDPSPAATELARGLERGLERSGRVRVVDQHSERLTLVDSLEPARDPVDGLDALLDLRLTDPERACSGGCRERVLDVEA